MTTPTCRAGSSALPTDRTPPTDVRNLSVLLGGNHLLLRWHLPPDTDFDHLLIIRTLAGGSPLPVYQGHGLSFIDPRLQYGKTYRYVIVSYDKFGNGSPGLVVLATPHRQRLLAPKTGAKLHAPVAFHWMPIYGATYYNLQLFLNGKKVLSVWPHSTSFTLARHWKWGGKIRHLVAGEHYTWFIWPGIGPRKQDKYGKLEGFSSFNVLP